MENATLESFFESLATIQAQAESTLLKAKLSQDSIAHVQALLNSAIFIKGKR